MAEQSQRRRSSQFPYTTLVEKGSDLIVLYERMDSAFQSLYLLLLLMLSGSIKLSPLLLILLLFVAKTQYFAKQRAFVVLFYMFHVLTFKIFGLFLSGKVS
jgi:hypothetical protein